MNESNERWAVDINRQTPNLNSILAMQVSRHRAKKQLFYVGRVEGGGGIPVSSDTGIRRSRILFIANFKHASSFLCVQLKIMKNKKKNKQQKQANDKL